MMVPRIQLVPAICSSHHPCNFLDAAIRRLHALPLRGLNPVLVFFESVNAENSYLAVFSVRLAKTQTNSRDFLHISLFHAEDQGGCKQQLVTSDHVTVVKRGEKTIVLLRHDPRDSALAPLDRLSGGKVWLVDCNLNGVGAGGRRRR
ncbi:hypothetical protein BDW22DRAFT_328079 [Trametopsis cervina]|nr:hypothetical protein BDW22DRAFT_328079 [Trametopsis cervina]